MTAVAGRSPSPPHRAVPVDDTVDATIAGIPDDGSATPVDRGPQIARPGRAKELTMQVFVVSPIPLFPSNGGNRRRIATMVEAIGARGHCVHFVLLDSRRIGDLDIPAHVRAYGDRFHFLKRNLAGETAYLAKRAAGMAKRKIKRKAGDGHWLNSADEIYYEPFTGQIRRIAASLRPDVFVVQYAFFSKSFDAAPADCFRVIDTHDSLSSALHAAEERRALLRAHHVIAIQSDEAATFEELLAGSRTTVSTIGHLLGDCPPIDPHRGRRATFIGSDFAANRLSLRYFLQNILPLIRRKLPDFELNVVGSIAKSMSAQPGVNRVGPVDDLAKAFADGPILINAIRAGTGLKIKLLEALSHGLPIVSTRSGVAGIDSRYLGGVKVVADEDAQAFADEVVSLATDRALRETASIMAYRSAGEWNFEQNTRIDRLLAAAAAHRDGHLERADMPSPIDFRSGHAHVDVTTGILCDPNLTIATSIRGSTGQSVPTSRSERRGTVQAS